MSTDSTIALVNMPFAPARGPSIQLGILRALALREGLHVREHYFNLDFLDLLRQRGLDAVYDSTLPPLVGEWFFSEHADARVILEEEPGEDLGEPIAILRRFAKTMGGTPDDLVSLKQELVPAFLAWCAAEHHFAGCSAACFTLTYPQICASMALATRLKESCPDLRIIMGGATSQIHVDSAREFMRVYPCVDAMVVGEAEAVFAPLMHRVLEGGSLRGLPGVVHRTSRGISRPTAPVVVTDLDDTPVPDYAVFAQKRESLPLPTRALVRAELPVEFARGCAWAKRKPCAFCGFYPHAGFRQKSATRILEEVDTLRHSLPWNGLLVMDAAVSGAQVSKLFQRLAQQHPGMTVNFLQVRPQLSRAHVAVLARAGVKLLQPGIESMESRLLKRMGKGTDVFNNLLLLKWCAEYGVGVSYNILMPIPGAQEEEMREQLRIMQLITHLAPPYPMRLVLVRQSHYVSNPDKHGITGLRPHPLYHLVFPSQLDVNKIAYHYVSDRHDRHLTQVHDATIRHIERWQRFYLRGAQPLLRWHPAASGMGGVLEERRNPAYPVARIQLEPMEALLFDTLMDCAMTLTQLERAVGQIPREQMKMILDGLVARSYVLHADERYLALATRAIR